MTRRPLRPLARILKARAEGEDPNLIEAEERAARLAERHRAERAKAYLRTGSIQRRLERAAESEQSLREAIRIQEELLAEGPSREETRRGLAKSLFELGMILGNGEIRQSESEAAFKKAIALLDQPTSGSPPSPEHRELLADLYDELGHLLERTGRLGEAEAARRALQHARQVGNRLDGDHAPARADRPAEAVGVVADVRPHVERHAPGLDERGQFVDLALSAFQERLARARESDVRGDEPAHDVLRSILQIHGPPEAFPNVSGTSSRAPAAAIRIASRRATTQRNARKRIKP